MNENGTTLQTSLIGKRAKLWLHAGGQAQEVKVLIEAAWILNDRLRALVAEVSGHRCLEVWATDLHDVGRD